MSRIGNAPIAIPDKVEVTLGGEQVTVKGPLGSLTQRLAGGVSVEREGDRLLCRVADGNPQANAMQGTIRALIANMVLGVTRGFEKKLNLVGVGYRAQASGDTLNLSVGYSHPVVRKMPKGITVQTPVQTEILVKGIDRQLVGQVAADIRSVRPPEPYKGKGVRYSDERVVIKETKKK